MYALIWTDIIPAFYTGKFCEQNLHFSTCVPPATGEQFLRKVVGFALSESSRSSHGNQLRDARLSDSVRVGSPGTDGPVELARLPNKQTLLADLATEIKAGKLVSLLFIDQDSFKKVNDQHGHSEGDRCLLEVVKQIWVILIGKGKLYRVGGEEFCGVLPNFPSLEAAATAARVRLSVDAVERFGGTAKATTSIGIADSSVNGLGDPDSLFKAADGAM